MVFGSGSAAWSTHMDAEIPPEAAELPMMRADELERLVAIELACECLLAHSERLAATEEPALQAA